MAEQLTLTDKQAEMLMQEDPELAQTLIEGMTALASETTKSKD